MDTDTEAALEAAINMNANDEILKFFRFSHLRVPLRDVSERFAADAVWIVTNLPRTAERTATLRKLLEGKDGAVRCALSLV